MRKYRKIIALSMIVLVALSMLAGCAGSSQNDARFNGKASTIQKLLNDIKETNNKGTYVINGGTSSNDQPSNEPADTPADNPTETPDEENPADKPAEENNGGSSGGNYEIVDYNTVCMSFNVLMYDTHGTGYAAPKTRAPWIVDTVKEYDPDLLGMQEVTKAESSTDNFDMYQYLVDSFSSKYDHRSLIDEKGKAGSTLATEKLTIGSGLVIFWKKDRFELKDSGAKVYTNDPGRHFQWVKLYDKEAKVTFIMTNTHFCINPNGDSTGKQGAANRAVQANELLSFWKKNVDESTPLYATGDYNHGTGEQAFAVLNSENYKNSRDIALSANATSGIDYIYVNHDAQEVFKYHRCNETYEPAGVNKPAEDQPRNPAYCPSDHYAIVAYCTQGEI